MQKCNTEGCIAPAESGLIYCGECLGVRASLSVAPPAPPVIVPPSPTEHAAGDTVIKDSGARREFATGAHRDRAVGKGAFHLIPFEPMLRMSREMGSVKALVASDPIEMGLSFLHKAADGFNDDYLGKCAAACVIAMAGTVDGARGVRAIPYAALERIAKVFEAGALKYTESNFRLGMPVVEYINSGLRHLHKASNGWTDEDHLAMCAWNCIAGMETQRLARMGAIPVELAHVNDFQTLEGTQAAFTRIRAANANKLADRAAAAAAPRADVIEQIVPPPGGPITVTISPGMVMTANGSAPVSTAAGVS